jgi:hypothetical protein
MKTEIAWSKSTPQLNTLNLIVLSALMVALVFLLQGDTGFNLADEGFLWYGTIRTALGEVPVRDFQSYEPGRYYWGALWFKLLQNDGILALRLSQAVFQFIGLTLGLLLLRRLLGSWSALIFAATILVRWLFPAWKIYEPVILIAAIYFAVLLIEQPSRKRHLAAGVFVGIAAFFGRNHGLFCGVAYFLLTSYLSWASKKVLLRRLATLVAGVVIGYLPMLLMLAFVSGFFEQVIADLVFNLKYGTNLPLPVPWPWRPDYQSLGTREAINKAAIGILYLAVPAFYVFALARLIFKRAASHHPIFVACSFVGTVYLQYTFARPQLFYLAWTIAPFILGLLALPASFAGQSGRRIAIGVWAILAVFTISVLEMAEENYFTIKPKAVVKAKLLGRHDGNFDQAMNAQGLLKTNVRGDHLWVLRDTATLMENLRPLQSELTKTNANILVAPYLPGLYATLRKPSPLWEIYFLLPRPLEEQQAMVRDLENKQVNWALVCTHYVDDRPELQFSTTHGLLWNYLIANFETVPGRLDQNCSLLRRRANLRATVSR